MADDAPTTLKKEPVSGFSPTPGCLIFVAFGLGLLCFSIWAGYSLITQSRAIDGFTADQPVSVVGAEPTEAETAAVLDKLKTFDEAIAAAETATVELTTREWNVLLLTSPSFQELYEFFSIESIRDGAVTAKISLPMNTLSFGGRRYLNGTLVFIPKFDERTNQVYCETEDIIVPGKTIAEGFLRRYKHDRYLDDMLLTDFREDKKIGPLLKKITKIEVKEGSVAITAAPDEPSKP